MFGYPRETNYGVLFDVRTVINPVNLAFTNRGISPHTDNPYRYPTPTLQVLHCMSASASGGDSVLVDGFKVAETLRVAHPDFFSILATTPVTFQYRDQDNWIENTTTIIQCNAAGIIQSIRYNNRSIQPVMQSIDKAVEFYEAYICWAKLVEDERFAISFRMDPGDLYLVDNERILHARTAFGNEGGERWLQGAYADRDGLLSRWRVLSHKISQTVI
jgi:gamma-butyrobetaine dioxygenase